MNTRGLMELVAINLGLDLGVVPRNVFFMLVMMAMVTTFMTSPVMRRLIQLSELHGPFLQSEFMRKRGSVAMLQRVS